jgi:hypothetical protein
MKIFDVDISQSVFLFLKSRIKVWKSVAEANETLRKICGIEGFFACDSEIKFFSEIINTEETIIACEKRAEYGDFQTNQTLAYKITEKIKKEGASPKIVIEPTCGKGHFILAVLNTFDKVEKIYGIEIQEKYTWQAKFNILDFFLNNPPKDTPEIHILHYNIFDFDYSSINKKIGKKELLIIGNPPWVTNSALSIMHSKNLPKKSNFKQQKGLDAMTGKGNFDIAEFITIDLLKKFGNCNGHMAFLVKNTVVKNIVQELPKLKLPLAGMEKQNIDSKKEFNVSVDASLFCCKLNQNTEYVCQESDFYTSKVKCIFGWRDNKFMSDLSSSNNDIDGISPFEWRQGIKHDCAKVMELEYDGEFFRNKLGEKFNLEKDLVYPLLKSSDLKSTCADPSRKLVIVTQKVAGQDTAYIQKYPQTFKYLQSHIDFFRSRKSSIYKGKYDFSIFGVGNYSFKPYKIAISGLYKTFHFCLVKPQANKPVMLDDTCYFIGFDSLEQAEYIWGLLNTEIVSNFLKKISFKDAKRMITKEVLMRIDLKKGAFLLGKKTNFLEKLSVNHDTQLNLFDDTGIIDNR